MADWNDIKNTQVHITLLPEGTNTHNIWYLIMTVVILLILAYLVLGTSFVSDVLKYFGWI